MIFLGSRTDSTRESAVRDAPIRERSGPNTPPLPVDHVALRTVAFRKKDLLARLPVPGHRGLGTRLKCAEKTDHRPDLVLSMKIRRHLCAPHSSPDGAEQSRIAAPVLPAAQSQIGTAAASPRVESMTEGAPEPEVSSSLIRRPRIIGKRISGSFFLTTTGQTLRQPPCYQTDQES